MSTIFISHSSKDDEIAVEVARRLEEDAGHASVFLDLDPEKGIVAGQSWPSTEVVEEPPPGDERVARIIRRLADRRHARVLLVIDQFEGLLGHEDAAHPANRFLGLLRPARRATQRGGRVTDAIVTDRAIRPAGERRALSRVRPTYRRR